MLYQRKSFSVPAAGPDVSQEDWDAIFGPRCPCGKTAAPPEWLPQYVNRPVCKQCFLKEWDEAMDRELENDMKSYRSMRQHGSWT